MLAYALELNTTICRIAYSIWLGAQRITRTAVAAAWRLCGWSWLLGSDSVGGAWVVWLDAGVRVGVFLVLAVWG